MLPAKTPELAYPVSIAEDGTRRAVTAFRHIDGALDAAKYCAGAKQAKLVNRYIELAAKTDRWRDFKKGVEWANYLGFSVRLLRERRPTEPALRDLFETLKSVQFAT